MEQGQVSVEEVLIVAWEADDSRDLSENIVCLVEDLDIVVTKADCDSLEVVPEGLDVIPAEECYLGTVPVLEVNTVGGSHHPAVAYQSSATEMTFVNPHGDLESDHYDPVMSRSAFTCQGYSLTSVSFPYRILPFLRLDLPRLGILIFEKSRVCWLKLGRYNSERTLEKSSRECLMVELHDNINRLFSNVQLA